jgi:hypothetical protein
VEDSRIMATSGELWPGMVPDQGSAIGRILTEGYYLGHQWGHIREALLNPSTVCLLTNFGEVIRAFGSSSGTLGKGKKVSKIAPSMRHFKRTRRKYVRFGSRALRNSQGYRCRSRDISG